MKYHVNNENKVLQCRANIKKCKFQHFDSLEEGLANVSRQYEEVGSITKGSSHRSSSPTVFLDANTEKVVGALSTVGKPYVVGGAVRDSFFGAENKDVDIEVYATDVDTITRHLRDQGYHVDEVGKQFGVLKVSKPRTRLDIDVSVPRTENKTGSKHTGFAVSTDPTMTVEQAVARRDFTFNAIMFDPETRKYVDPTGGRQDLNDRVMRHVSDKFSEDPLRVLRGFQFASRFDMKYAPETAQLCRDIRGTYSELSSERVREEWTKFFSKGTKHIAGARALQDSGWDDTEPGLRESLKNPSTITGLSNLSKVRQDKRTIVGPAIISSAMSDKDAQSFCRKMCPSQKEARSAMLLRKYANSDLSTTAERKWAARFSGFTFEDLNAYGTAMRDSQVVDYCRQARTEGIYRAPEKDLVDGNQVMTVTGRKPGPWMKDALNDVRDQQYTSRVRTPEEALDYVRRTYGKTV